MRFATPCEECHFVDRDKHGCQLGHQTAMDGQFIWAAGNCRMFRTPEWAEKNKNYLLEAAARLEASFRYDLVVLFDERTSNAAQLERTIKNSFDNHRPEHIIVIDTTPIEGRAMVAINLMNGLAKNDKLQHVPFSVVLELEPTKDDHDAIWRSYRKIRSPYFLVIKSGYTIFGLWHFTRFLREIDTRAVFFYFPIRSGRTLTSIPTAPWGVYLTKAYQDLGGGYEQPFWKTIDDAQKLAGVGLRWLFSDCQMTGIKVDE